MPGKRPHPRGSIIAYIWIGTVVAGYLLLLFSQDDAYTDDGTGVGVLIAVVSFGLTGVYRALARFPLEPRAPG